MWPRDTGRSEGGREGGRWDSVFPRSQLLRPAQFWRGSGADPAVRGAESESYVTHAQLMSRPRLVGVSCD